MTERTLLVLRIPHGLKLACSDSNETGKQSHKCGGGREDPNLPNEGVSTTLAMLFISLHGVVPLMETNNLRQC